jgi:hypothetical protein
MAADALAARQLTSKKTNPEFTLSDLGSEFSIGETAAYIMFFGDMKSGTAPKSLVEYLFG